MAFGVRLMGAAFTSCGVGVVGVVVVVDITYLLESTSVNCSKRRRADSDKILLCISGIWGPQLYCLSEPRATAIRFDLCVFIDKEVVHRKLSSEEANGWDRKVQLTNKTKLMQHQQVIENSVRNGQGGRGTYLKADEDVLYSKFPENYRPYGSYDSGNDGQTTPLAVQLGDGTSSTSFSRDWQPAQKGR